MGQLEGKVAVVTGGGSGMGRATAVRLAAEGAHVFINGRRQAQLDETVEIIGDDRATTVAGDVSDLADLDRLYDAVGEFGRGLDIVFANAAAAALVPLEHTTAEHVDHIFGVNVRGTLFTVQKALPLLNDGGSIILNASTAGERGIEAFGAYAASKAAVRSFARTWTAELKGRNIRVNAISPGSVDTPMIDDLVGAGEAAAVKAGLAETIPVGRVAQPEEIASVVAFLASSDSSFVAGANLFIDGGADQV